MASSIPGAARLGKSYLLVLLLLLFCPPARSSVQDFAPGGAGPRYPALSDGRVNHDPSIEAQALGDQAITMDGVLDDPVWAMADTGFGFLQHEPDRFGRASVPTTFKVVYDRDAIYFGVACWENDLDDVASYLGRRDQIQASDLVSVYIDPYHDRTTGYNFRVNPDGVQEDSYLFDDGNRDTDWNGVWEAAVSSDERGWYVEMRIPFSVIRFTPADDMTWGLQVYRWLHGRGEDTGWATWDRNLSGFVSRWGSLTGLRGVANPRKLEVTPYMAAKAIDPAEADQDRDAWSHQQNLGADFKYGLTSNLTLNATIQPDFGQVEADPANLNLSPFETWFAEKRPFFIEGARFFQQPSFDLFYSRRIGTGDPNSRIRGAAKLTGKMRGDVSVAVLAAATDVGVPGKTHNPLVTGEQRTAYGLVRLGKEFSGGDHRINIMGTAVRRDQDSFREVSDARLLRDGYSGGLDFQMNWLDRTYRLSGSFVGTHVVPFQDLPGAEPEPETYGTGGIMELEKIGGHWRGELMAGWEHDQLDPNDLGYLQAPDEKYTHGALAYYFDSDGQDAAFNNGNVELAVDRSWLYAGNSAAAADMEEPSWTYGAGHHQSSSVSLSAWAQHRSYHQGYIYVGRNLEGTSKYTTRGTPRQPGPLMTTPAYTHFSCGGTSDYRRPVSVSLDLDLDRGEHYKGENLSCQVRWNQSQHLSHTLGLGFGRHTTDAQWLANLANDDSQAGVTGIGGVDHVFGRLEQTTWDLTLRSSLLLDRNRSLQLYLQPYLTNGDYSDPRWLATPDSYDLRPYQLDAASHDFNFAALNLNLVYRWEYRPGSTLFLVWTHSKSHYEERGMAGDPARWTNDFRAADLTDSEPRNTFLAKFSYYFSI